MEYKKIRNKVKESYKRAEFSKEMHSHDSIIETHLKSLSNDESETLRKILIEKQMLRFPLQITYDLFNSTPIHRAFSQVKLPNEPEEEFEIIYRE